MSAAVVSGSGCPPWRALSSRDSKSLRTSSLVASPASPSAAAATARRLMGGWSATADWACLLVIVRATWSASISYESVGWLTAKAACRTPVRVASRPSCCSFARQTPRSGARDRPPSRARRRTARLPIERWSARTASRGDKCPDAVRFGDSVETPRGPRIRTWSMLRSTMHLAPYRREDFLWPPLPCRQATSYLLHRSGILARLKPARCAQNYSAARGPRIVAPRTVGDRIRETFAAWPRSRRLTKGRKRPHRAGVPRVVCGTEATVTLARST